MEYFESFILAGTPSWTTAHTIQVSEQCMHGVAPLTLVPKIAPCLAKVKLPAPIRARDYSYLWGATAAPATSGVPSQPPPSALYSFTKSVAWVSSACASCCRACTVWSCTVSTVM